MTRAVEEVEGVSESSTRERERMASTSVLRKQPGDSFEHWEYPLEAAAFEADTRNERVPEIVDALHCQGPGCLPESAANRHGPSSCRRGDPVCRALPAD